MICPKKDSKSECNFDCAWWDVINGQCAILSIKNALRDIAKELARK